MKSKIAKLVVNSDSPEGLISTSNSNVNIEVVSIILDAKNTTDKEILVKLIAESNSGSVCVSRIGVPAKSEKTVSIVDSNKNFIVLNKGDITKLSVAAPKGTAIEAVINME